MTGDEKTINLWVDDERSAPPGWTWVETNEDAIGMMELRRVEHLSLDFSLAHETTDEIMYWLRQNPQRWPTGSIVCHSSSASAQALIERLAKKFAPTAG